MEKKTFCKNCDYFRKLSKCKKKSTNYVKKMISFKIFDKEKSVQKWNISRFWISREKQIAQFAHCPCILPSPQQPTKSVITCILVLWASRRIVSRKHLDLRTARGNRHSFSVAQRTSSLKHTKWWFQKKYMQISWKSNHFRGDHQKSTG